MKKLQLGLIFGGRSCEHEVSVISALQLALSVDRAKYVLHPIYINKSGEWFSGPGLLALDAYKEPIMYTQKGKYERVILDVTAHSGALVRRAVTASSSRGGVCTSSGSAKTSVA